MNEKENEFLRQFFKYQQAEQSRNEESDFLENNFSEKISEEISSENASLKTEKNIINLKEKLEEKKTENEMCRTSRKFHINPQNSINLKEMVNGIEEEKRKYEAQKYAFFYQGYWLRTLHDVRARFEPWLGVLAVMERGLHLDQVYSKAERKTRLPQEYLNEQFVPAYELSERFAEKKQEILHEQEAVWEEIFEETTHISEIAAERVDAEKIEEKLEEEIFTAEIVEEIFAEDVSENSSEIVFSERIVESEKTPEIFTEEQAQEKEYILPKLPKYSSLSEEDFSAFVERNALLEKTPATILTPQTPISAAPKSSIPEIPEERTEMSSEKISAPAMVETEKMEEEIPAQGFYADAPKIFSQQNADAKKSAWENITKSVPQNNAFVAPKTHNPLLRPVPLAPEIAKSVAQPISQAISQAIPAEPAKPLFTAEDVQKVANGVSESWNASTNFLGETAKNMTATVASSLKQVKNFSKTLPQKFPSKNLPKVPKRTQEKKDLLLHALPHSNSFPKKETIDEEESSFWEFVKIGAVVCMLFLGSMGVLNYSAYLDRTEKYWNASAFEEKQNALASLVFSKKEENLFANIESLPVAGEVSSKKSDEISPLNLEVFPPDMRIVIPKLGKNIPIVDVPADSIHSENWSQLEKDIQEGLREGVVHYPGTATPGQNGNVFITGHSSYYPWDKGRYKDVFAALHDLQVGDEYFIYANGKKYQYKISERKVVKPSDVSVLEQDTTKKTSTLMTCTPIGSTAKRLILQSEQVN